ncbi:hypothetical protein IP88_16745 [alpha proteobacterium AAP81b]|nr:hypothetical protein IP88_16745 [alpha proteobacterium AAP81b]
MVAAISSAERRLAFAAVLIVLFLGALDQTIVATAMPRIVAELAGLDRIAWVGTAYLLTSTVTVPIYGKLGDLFGRRPVLEFGVIVFLIGSMLCGLAGEFGALPLIGDGMNQLILCRSLQGIGAGALTTGAFATVADLVPPAERGRYTGMFGAMFGLAGLAGPVLGGLLTDHASTTILGAPVSGWRFIFYVNLPLGLVALTMLVRALPAGRRGADARIDWTGSALIILATVPLLLALGWGGDGGGFGQPRVVIGFGIAAAAFAVFLAASRGKPHAVVPLDLFADRVVARGSLALFLVNLAYMGVPMFLPLYLQTVRGLSASASGIAMLPLLFGILIGSMTAGQTARRTRAYKPVLVAGGTLTLVALAVLTRLGPDWPRWLLPLDLFVLGLGLGPAQGMFTLAIQSAVTPARTGVATAASQFCRQMGATVGVAVFGALMTHGLARELDARVPVLVGGDPAVLLSRAQTLAMDPVALAGALAAAGVDGAGAAHAAGLALIDSFAFAIEALFPVALALMVLAFLMTLSVPARRLRGAEAPAAAHDPDAAVATA